MPTLITDNPTIVPTIVAALLALGAAFGLNLTQEQSAAILGLFTAIVALGVVMHKTTVPKTPSDVATSASIQQKQPPPPAPIVAGQP
jgi:uncharacterized protein (DUF697 family)